MYAFTNCRECLGGTPLWHGLLTVPRRSPPLWHSLLTVPRPPTEGLLFTHGRRPKVSSSVTQSSAFRLCRVSNWGLQLPPWSATVFILKPLSISSLTRS